MSGGPWSGERNGRKLGRAEREMEIGAFECRDDGKMRIELVKRFGDVK